MFPLGPAPGFAVGTKPVANTTADLNGDGHLDLLVANFGDNSVSVLLGDGYGGCTPAAPVPVNGPHHRPQ